MPSPREVIEDIRRNEYGIGLPTGSEERIGFEKMRPKLDRAIQHLSEDLYSEDIHFVLELVQNADDNTYPPGVEPFIRFVRRGNVLHILNNEIGFQEKNVRAVCDIGKSSKSKALGYIGEKGIGFKSVFRVSDEPLVVSNGYQFRFHREAPATGLGFVVPEWVEQVPDFVDPSLTNIVLPLRQQDGEEASQISRLAPGLLLFLKKIKRIEIQTEPCDSPVVHRRVDGTEAVTLQSGQATKQFKLVARDVVVPDNIREAKRQGIEQSEVVLAFPLSNEGSADATTERQVYAYLPVQRCGFRFLIQADFVLASSREAILCDRAWNQLLRDQVAPAFMQAVEQFKQNQCGVRTTFMAFVPEKKLADPFFAPVRDQIFDGLRQSACILTALEEWKKPGETVVDALSLRPLVGDDDVQGLLNRDYVHDNFKATRSQLESLGVLVFGVPELVRCLSVTEWLSQKDPAWFARLFACLARQDLKEGVERLKALAIIPLEDGTLASSKSRRLFLPLDKSASYGFEDKLPIVSKGLFVGVQPEVAADARKFLRTLGVRKADPADIIADYILPIFEANEGDDSWNCKGDDFCIGSIHYIRDHLKEYQEAGHHPSRLTSGLWIRFIDPPDNRYWRSNCLYLSAEYGNNNSLEELLEGVPNACFVDGIYLERSLKRLAGRWKKPFGSESIQRKKSQEAKAWHSFFTAIGVASTIRVDRVGTATEPKQARSPHLQALFETADPNRLRRVAQHLDANWDSFRGFMETTVVRNSGRSQVPLGKKQTWFGELLSGSKWVPTSGGSFGLPAEVHLDDSDNRALLGDSDVYLGMEIKDARLIDEVGLRRVPTVGRVLERLGKLAVDRSPDVDTVRRLYTFLDHHYEAYAAVIDAAFGDRPLFCLPSREPRYLRQAEVFWHDVGPIFEGSRGCLSEHWSDLKGFFVQKLEVPLRPSAEDYVTLLSELTREESLTARQEKVVWAVYRELDRHLRTDPDGVMGSDWWKEFASNGAFWAEGDTFWVNAGDLFVNDRRDLHSLFADHPGIGFLKLPDNQHPHVSRFLRAAGIPLVSQAVRIEMPDSSPHCTHADLTARCRRIVPFILRYLFYREQEFYQEREREGNLDELLRTEVRIDENLRVVVALRDVRREAARPFASRFPTIYVRRDSEGDLDGLAAELSRMIGGSPGLEMFIAAALSKPDAQAIERLMQAQGIPPLPSDGEEPLEAATTPEEFENAPEIVAEHSRSESHDEKEDNAVDEDAGMQEDLPGGPELVQEPDGAELRQRAALTLETAGGDSQHGEGGNVDDLIDQSEREEADELRDNEPESSGGSTSRRVAASQDHTSACEASSTVWKPGSAAEFVAVRMSEVVPSVVEERVRATRTRPADGRPSAGMEDSDFGDPVSSPHALDIGRWGEQYAVSCLRSELAHRYPHATIETVPSGYRFLLGQSVIAEIRWHNWERDVGVGCDIELSDQGAEEYIEVKTTSGNSRATFEVTAAQWALARHQRAAYRIVRVFNAGNANAFAQWCRDPYGMWEEGRLIVRTLQIVL